MLSIPTITTKDIVNYYSVVRVTHFGIFCPFDVIEITVNKDWETPQHPTETIMFFQDTIYEQPREVSIKAYIKAGMLAVLEAQIKLSTKLGQGFTIYTMGGVYSNMFITSIARSETADVNTGYMLDITFTEVVAVGSLINTIVNAAINATNTAVATAVNCADQGSVQSVSDGALELGDTALQLGLGAI